MAGLYPLLAMIAIIVLLFVFLAIGKEQHPKFVTVKIGKASVSAELADTEFKQMRGLMFRESIPRDGGMLFKFPREADHGIWMMNMSIPIDIVWLDSEKRVVKVEEGARPCEALLVCPVYRAGESSRYVLELSSGYAKSHGIKRGTVARFNEKIL